MDEGGEAKMATQMMHKRKVGWSDGKDSGLGFPSIDQFGGGVTMKKATGSTQDISPLL